MYQVVDVSQRITGSRDSYWTGQRGLCKTAFSTVKQAGTYRSLRDGGVCNGPIGGANTEGNGTESLISVLRVSDAGGEQTYQKLKGRQGAFLPAPTLVLKGK